MTDRAGRWVTEQVGRNGRSVSEVARELDCDWHTVVGMMGGDSSLDPNTCPG